MVRFNAILIGLLFSLSAFAFEESNCVSNLEVNPFMEILKGTKDLLTVSEANKTRTDLIRANITYSFAGIGVGKADVYLMEKEGKIVDLNVYAKVGVLGVNQVIKEKVTISQLKRGEPLEFEMDGGDRPVLVIEPEADFDENGGWATLKVWDGSRYQIEKIGMFKKNGKFKAYKGVVSNDKEIVGLDINMSGMSISKMYIRKYKVKTKR